MSYNIKDSGSREEYPSGMVRDTQKGKPDYTLLPRFMLTRWAMHLTKGAEKYGRENWKLAESEEEMIRFKASAFRHLIQWLEGESDEDHAAAILFNVSAAEYVKEKLRFSDPWAPVEIRGGTIQVKGNPEAWGTASIVECCGRCGLPKEKIVSCDRCDYRAEAESA